MFEKTKSWISSLKLDVLAVYFVARDPSVNWGLKLLAFATAAYVFSPIDLIPDCIPIIGYFDELILVPTAIWLILKLTPETVLVRCRLEAKRQFKKNRPVSIFGAAIVVIIWVFFGFSLWWWFMGVDRF